MDEFLKGLYETWVEIADGIVWIFGLAYGAFPETWNPVVKGLIVGGVPVVVVMAVAMSAGELARTIGGPRQWFRRFVMRLRSPYGRASWAKLRDLKKLGLLNDSGLFLGQWRGWFRRTDLLHQGEGHFVTIALPGGGKSTAALIPSLLTSKHGSFIITDPKGEITAITRRHRETCSRVVYLNPFYKDFEEGTGLDYPDTGFNPFDMIRNDENAPADCANFAQLLMVTDRKESGSYFQTEGADDILALCDTKQFFAVGEYAHAKDISEMCGERSVFTRNQQEEAGEQSFGTVGVPLIRPEEVTAMKKNEQIIIRRGKPIKARLVPYFTRARWLKITDDNPYR